jgi:hypothetical protein
MAKLLTSRPTWQDRRGARLIRPGGGRPAASASVPCVYANLIDSDNPTTNDLDTDDPPRWRFSSLIDYPYTVYYGGSSPATASSHRKIYILLKFETAVNHIGVFRWPLASASTEGIGSGNVQQEDVYGYIDYAAGGQVTKAGFNVFFKGITEDYDPNTVTWNTSPTTHDDQKGWFGAYVGTTSDLQQVKAKIGRTYDTYNETISMPVYVGATEGGPYYGLEISCDINDASWSTMDNLSVRADWSKTNRYCYITTDVWEHPDA